MGYAVSIVEPYDIPEEHVAGLAYSEQLSSGDWRFVFYCERRGERIAKFALTMPADQVTTSMQDTAVKFGYSLVMTGQRGHH